MSKREEIEKRIRLLREKKRREAAQSFWHFANALYPNFFKPERDYLKVICNAMEGIYFETLINEKTGKPYKKLALSVPPSMGKSFCSTLFSAYLLSKDEDAQVITVSYNEKMSSKFGQQVRDTIMMPPGGNPSEFVLGDVFPDVKVKDNDSSKQNWSLEGRYNSFLATSFTGTLTGFRGKIGIIDDPVKSALEAYNENKLNEIFDWYADTFLSRILEGGSQIIIQTRWSKRDLIGRLLELEPDEWYVVNLPAYDKEKDEMLCEDIMSRQRYEALKRITSHEIFMANYQQQTVDSKNKLFTNLKNYEEKPESIKERICLVDPADTGEDSLVAIIADVAHNGQAYVVDVYMTKEDMDITAPRLAELLTEHRVRRVRIERNAAGRVFSSNVEKHLRNDHKNRFTTVETFPQKKNKEARIFSYAHVVERDVFFPINWRFKFEDYYAEMNAYQKKGKNKHDDAPDCTTMLVETIEQELGTDDEILDKYELGL
ncbi:phage terminase large subunit [Rossellomorea vietnamensis]|uniref:Phage terminase large subunit n=1 Tax=Rossellomorea vietnamensis TaxID=218284 RepID=A0A5D4M1A2_9BACI|nr:phage terminase large subunit [Rossellomorea vietnamensis]TYR95714.1 phage terminase large subunit [Rossellomorea vietnamensis]